MIKISPPRCRNTDAESTKCIAPILFPFPEWEVRSSVLRSGFVHDRHPRLLSVARHRLPRLGQAFTADPRSPAVAHARESDAVLAPTHRRSGAAPLPKGRN